MVLDYLMPAELAVLALAGTALLLRAALRAHDRRGLIGVDYYIQIATLQPSLVKGEMEGLALVTQYNPHGIFIALEELGYLLMSLAFLFVGFVFAGTARLDRAIRWLLIGGAVAAFVAYGVLSIIYGRDLEYRHETGRTGADIRRTKSAV